MSTSCFKLCFISVGIGLITGDGETETFVPNISDLNVPAHLFKEASVSLADALATLKDILGLERQLIFVIEAHNIIFWWNKVEISVKCVEQNKQREVTKSVVHQLPRSVKGHTDLC